MKFSLKIFLSLIIFVGMTVLVFQQVLVLLKKNPELSLQNAIIQTINPFWSIGNQNIVTFPISIPITIENPTSSDLIPNGDVTLWHNNEQIPNIGVIDKENNPPGFLVNSLPINPDNIKVAPNSSYTFQVQWEGFGDAFFEKNPETGGLGNAVIHFDTPSHTFQSRDVFQIAFYEKLVLEKHIYEVTVKSNIISLNPETGNQSRQQIDDFTIKIPYYTTEKAINMGMVLNFGFTIIFILLLWNSFSGKSNNKKLRISKETFDKLESELYKKNILSTPKISHKTNKNKENHNTSTKKQIIK